MLIETKKGPLLTPGDIDKIAQAIKFVNENHLKKINSCDLSERYYITEEKIQKGFKKITGYSVHHYLEILRYGTAVELLSDPEKTIKQVAATLSMSDSYFVQFFKRYSDMTPAKFRATRFSME